MKTKKNKSTEVKQSISYSGNVTLKLAKDKKILKTLKVKNMGTLSLLRGIGLYLLQSQKTSLLPSFMGIGSSDAKGSYSDDSLKSEIIGRRVILIKHNLEELKDEKNKEHIGYIVKYSASFPSELVGENTIKELGLFSDQNTNSLLARIILGSEVQIPVGLSLIVEWNINIQNKPE